MPWKSQSHGEVTFDLFFFQVGDAGDPGLPDAPPISPGGVEESYRRVHNSALPQHGKNPVLYSSEDRWHLMGTVLHKQTDFWTKSNSFVPEKTSSDVKLPKFEYVLPKPDFKCNALKNILTKVNPS